MDFQLSQSHESFILPLRCTIFIAVYMPRVIVSSWWNPEIAKSTCLVSTWLHPATCARETPDVPDHAPNYLHVCRTGFVICYECTQPRSPSRYLSSLTDLIGTS